jgi:hypothetical protein
VRYEKTEFAEFFQASWEPVRIATDRVRELDARRGDPDEVRARLSEHIPLRRYGEQEEFGRAAAFVLSPAASYITGSVRLAAFSVTSGPGPSTTLVLRKGPQYPRLDPDALRQALARQGIPALVTVGTFCRSAHGAAGGTPKVVHASEQADGSDAVVIDGRAIPPGERLSIGLFPGHTRMLLIKDGAPLTCSSTSQQPAARIAPTGTPIRT